MKSDEWKEGLTRTEIAAQRREIREKRCAVCVHGRHVIQDYFTCRKNEQFPQCMGKDVFRLKIDDTVLWIHKCSVQGWISTAKGCACDWCGETE